MITSDPLYCVPDHIQTRWASAENWRGEKGGSCRGNDGRKRSPCFCLKAGQSKTLAEVAGSSGMVRRIWATIMDRSPKMLRGLRLEIFWDGAATPAVSAPLGDFFGHGLGRMATFQNALFASPEGRSFNCYIPMPFRTGMRIVVTNETDTDLIQFYFDVNYTLGDQHGPDALCFHAHWRRECPTTLGRDYEFLPLVSGRGRFLGVNVGVIADTQTYFKTWWGEGEVKFYLDGDTDHPTLCGTGTEDYIGTGWGQGEYAHAFQGCPIADGAKFQYCFYRLHVPDPVFFHRDIRVTMQQIGCWDPQTLPQMHGMGMQLFQGDQPVDMAQKMGERTGGGEPNRWGEVVIPRGYGIFERRDDWSSCAWFYLDQPGSPLPSLPPSSARMAGLV